ncbi:hypothetical protein UFOVP177_45 [uncultured Caudovirales phage]|uniref:Uncharacterized protein n=1 Tax=uncultured Caudovirales phage TaxID=2100421 RepID=A0A6J7WIW3_9CAUD|nr:hypothetical protein UFOVP177_45 [uncultured Caudovirales phage]
MYVPRIGSRRAEFIDIVNKSGGITVERIIQKHGMMNFANSWDMTTELRKLVRYKCIKQIGNVFFPIYKDNPNPIDEKQLVPPREAVPFKPLKTFPPTVSPRGQPIERRSFKTCKSNVRYQSKNDL